MFQYQVKFFFQKFINTTYAMNFSLKCNSSASRCYSLFIFVVFVFVIQSFLLFPFFCFLSVSKLHPTFGNGRMEI